jgi:pyruvate kinase
MAVKKAADSLGCSPFVIAKIERAGALNCIDEILEAADGIMIARGDLGVEIPIEQIAVVQKDLMEKANMAGKPVITATQMLESMIVHSRPNRSEATDVANAIMDGTDCVMLSGESAMGKYPVKAVAMLSKIAEATEPNRPRHRSRENVRTYGQDDSVNLVDIISLNVNLTLERITPAAIIIPTVSGDTARSIGRFRLPVWLVAVCPGNAACQRLQFSYGVFPVHMPEYPEDWNSFIRQWLRSHGIKGKLAVMTEGPSTKNPDSNNRMEIIDLERF